MRASVTSLGIPDTANSTKRAFDAKVREWRRNLHAYDDQEISSLELLVRAKQEIHREIDIIEIPKDLKNELYQKLQASFDEIITSSSQAASAASTGSSNVSANDSDDDSYTRLYKQAESEGAKWESQARVWDPKSIWN